MYSFQGQLIPSKNARRSVHSDPGDIRFNDKILVGIEPYRQPCNIALLGIPQDIGVARNGGRVGASMGANAIRTALYRLTISRGMYTLPDSFTIADFGDINCLEKSLEQIHDEQQAVVSELLQHAELVIVLGGGHDIAFPDGLALASQHKNIGIINVDAHPDVRPFVEVDGVALRHSGSPFRQLIEHPDMNLAEGAFVEYGIQTFSAAATHLHYVFDKGYQVMLLDDLLNEPIRSSFERAWAHTAAADAVYCSLDIDSVSSAYAPGVSAPAVDGLSAREILDIAEFLGSQRKCRLVDIVEVNPEHDEEGRTAKLAAKIVAEIITARSRHHA